MSQFARIAWQIPPGLLGIVSGLVYSLIAVDGVRAQIVPDNTLPVNSRVEAGCTTCTIEGGTTQGNNLFHSFQEFSVPTGGAAIFNNAGQVQNIFTRVTGNSISKIDGLLRANGSANLFLLNPNGMFFGPNARLDIRGSLVASTANGILIDHGLAFTTTNPQAPPLLTISTPIGLQYGANPGRIGVQGTLQVGSGQTLALVGGDVLLEGGTLKAEAGRIELGSVAAGSSVAITPTTPGLALNYQDVTSFQDVRLTQASRVDASGRSGGSIQVQGRRISLTEGSQIITITQGPQAGKDLIVGATESVEVVGFDSRDGTSSRFAAQTRSTGNAGNLTIATGALRVTNGGHISTRTLGSGNSGNLTVQAQSVDVISFNPLDDENSHIATQTSAGSTGNAGELTLETGTLRLVDGGYVSTSTSGAGNASKLFVRAKSIEATGFVPGTGSPSQISAQASGNSTGNAGSLTIETGTLRLSDSARISTRTLGKGDGGDLIVRSQLVEVTGFNPQNQASSYLATQARAGSTGNAGNLTIETEILRVMDGAVITTDTFGPGKAGNLTVRAQSIEVSGFFNQKISYLATQARPGSTGNAGGISLITHQLRLANQAEIRATGAGTGSAGNIEIQAASGITMVDDARISSNTNAGRGNITLTAPLLLLRRDSSITTNANGNATGGNIRLEGGFIVAVSNENSDITANAFAGKGGRVDITAQGIFGIEFRPRPTSRLSDITASSELGIAGVVALNTPNTDLNRGLAELPTNIIDASKLVAVGCSPEVASQANRGEFYQTGRGGVAPLPTDSISSNDILEDLEPPQSWNTATAPNGQIVEAQGWQRNDRGQVELVAAPSERWHCGR